VASNSVVMRPGFVTHCFSHVVLLPSDYLKHKRKHCIVTPQAVCILLFNLPTHAYLHLLGFGQKGGKGGILESVNY